MKKPSIRKSHQSQSKIEINPIHKNTFNPKPKKNHQQTPDFVPLSGHSDNKSSSQSKTDIRSFLTLIRKKAKSEREKGELFERAIRDFLRKSPEHDFGENVWMRREWPDLKKYNLPKKDLGIDLIAKEKETGKYWFYQIKTL